LRRLGGGLRLQRRFQRQDDVGRLADEMALLKLLADAVDQENSNALVRHRRAPPRSVTEDTTITLNDPGLL
jgi:hypothetical protein